MSLSQKKVSPPMEIWRNFARKFHAEKHSNLDDELQFAVDEYNRETSPTSSSSSSPSTFKFYVTAKTVVPESLPSQRKCSEISLHCHFCNMKRSSKKESFGFVISPLAKITTGTALVETVYSNSPAEKGGLLPGDRIMTVNGKRMDDKVDVDILMEDDLDVELAVARVQRLSLNEFDQGTSTKETQSLSKSSAQSSSKGDVSSKKGSKSATRNEKYPENDEELRHQYSWGTGTGTIIDRYPEARHMLRMLGRGPYSDHLRDYSCIYY